MWNKVVFCGSSSSTRKLEIALQFDRAFPFQNSSGVLGVAERSAEFGYCNRVQFDLFLRALKQRHESESSRLTSSNTLHHTRVGVLHVRPAYPAVIQLSSRFQLLSFLFRVVLAGQH